MVCVNTVCKTVRDLIKEYQERDPWRLSKAMQIAVSKESMGSFPDSCKGFFICCYGISHITINADLPSDYQSLVLAHELGHAVLHKNISETGFRDISLFHTDDFLEYEANLFAAELLISDDDIIALLHENIPFFSMAKMLCVVPELLDYKLRLLKHKGYDVVSPVCASSDFFKNIVLNP